MSLRPDLGPRLRLRVPTPPWWIAKALETDLRASIEGEVRFDKVSRALYSTDASVY